MKLHILGTGNGSALNCYNTCFAIENNNEYLLVDGGGGNQILNQLKHAKIDINKIHNIFLTHNHTDHILGVIWVIRNICLKMKFSESYQGTLNIYGSDESMGALKLLTELLFPMAKQFLNRISFIEVKDKESININNMNLMFFDINAKKDKQFGFIINNQLAFCGDEPLNENLFSLMQNKNWLIHESFCLEQEKDFLNPYGKGHCTVKDASIIAQKVNAKNLIILHTADNDLLNRKTLYSNEAKQFFKGNIFVPNDLEIIEIN